MKAGVFWSVIKAILELQVPVDIYLRYWVGTQLASFRYHGVAHRFQSSRQQADGEVEAMYLWTDWLSGLRVGGRLGASRRSEKGYRVNNPTDAGQIVLGALFDFVARTDDNRKGHVVAELAIITLLIDAKIVTIEQVCERLELIQSVLPEEYQTEETTLRTRVLTEWLRAHARPDGQRWAPTVIEGGRNHD